MKKLTITTALLSIIFSASYGQDQWQKDHPRRTQVNQRLKNQDKRINKEQKSGEISKGEAAKLHKNDHKMRHEERDMASQNHGHITKQEKKTLNRQENKNSRKIGK
jgi:hypothetical protein